MSKKTTCLRKVNLNKIFLSCLSFATEIWTFDRFKVNVI